MSTPDIGVKEPNNPRAFRRPVLVTGQMVLDFTQHLVDLAGEDYTYKNEFTNCQNFAVTTKWSTELGKDVTLSEEPRCIVGRFFYWLGLSYNECGNATVSLSIEQVTEKRPEFRFTKLASALLQVQQSNQDNGGTWGAGKIIATDLANNAACLGILDS